MILSSLTFVAFSNQYRFHPKSRLHIGGGNDPFKPGEAYPSCLEHDGIEAVSTGNMFTSSLEITGISSSRDFYQKTGFSSSLEASSFFYSGEVSFSFDFEKELSEKSVSWLVVLRADYGDFFLKNPRLKSELIGLTPKQIANKCGTEFVLEEKRSVMVYTLLSLKNLKIREKREILAHLNIVSNAGFLDGSFEASYKDFMQKAQSMGQVSIKIYTRGGGGIVKFKSLLDLNTFMNHKAILNTFQTYLNQINYHHAVPHLYTTAGLAKFIPDSFSPVGFKKATLTNLYYRYRKLITKISKLDNLIDSGVSSFEDSLFYQGERSKIHHVLERIKDAASSCFRKDDQGKCSFNAIDYEYENPKVSQIIHCEAMRDKALKNKLIGLDFYEMARERNFIPVFKGSQICRWKPCFSKI